jgi:hypothetical protein
MPDREVTPSLAYRIGKAIPIVAIVGAHVLVLAGIVLGVWLWTR